MRLGLVLSASKIDSITIMCGSSAMKANILLPINPLGHIIGLRRHRRAVAEVLVHTAKLTLFCEDSSTPMLQPSSH